MKPPFCNTCKAHHERPSVYCPATNPLPKPPARLRKRRTPARKSWLCLNCGRSNAPHTDHCTGC